MSTSPDDVAPVTEARCEHGATSPHSFLERVQISNSTYSRTFSWRESQGGESL
jgi:hypothetical protein